MKQVEIWGALNLNDALKMVKAEAEKFGWHDRFRVYGYPEENFYDAQTLIDFLKNYDQKMVGPDKSTGFNTDIENIIKDFFDKFPNGMVNFG